MPVTSWPETAIVLQQRPAEHMTIGLAFVGVSLARGYLLRRLFEAIRVQSY